MTDAQSTRYGLDAAAARQRTFLTVYRIVLVVEAACAVAVVALPGSAARAMTTAPGTPLRLWGMALLFGLVLQLPALAAPIHARFTVIASIAGRLALLLGYLLLRCWLPAALAGVAALALWVAFARMLYAEIDSKP